MTEKITVNELCELFGDSLPMAALQILWDGTDDRTADEVRAEIEALAKSMREAK